MKSSQLSMTSQKSFTMHLSEFQSSKNQTTMYALLISKKHTISITSKIDKRICNTPRSQNTFMNPNHQKLTQLAVYVSSNIWTTFHTFIRCPIKNEFNLPSNNMKWLILRQMRLIKNLMSTIDNGVWYRKFVHQLLKNAFLFLN